MQHPSARRAETRPGRVAKQSVQLHASCSRTLYGAGVHRLACLPTNQRGRLCIRTNSSGNGRNLNLDKFEWIVVGSFGGGQTDLVVIVAFVHRSCRERLWQSVPLRRTRCRFDSVDILETRNDEVSASKQQPFIHSWSNFVDVFVKVSWPVSNKGMKFISFDTAPELISPNLQFKQKISQGIMSRFEPQEWIYIYIYKATVEVE